MSANETKARLRDRREPGHFWADNEIIDVFGDELGQNGISVYMTMTRFCFGTEVRLSLREIAAAARMSKDTVARSMKVLVALGLVIETKGARAKTVSTWSLANVKALVQEYIRESVSPRDRLKTSQSCETVRPAAQTTLVQLVKEQRTNCLTVRQIEKETKPSCSTDFPVDKKNSVAQDATDLSQMEAGFETDLSHQTGPLIYKTQDTKLQDKNNPLPPSQANGEQVSSDAGQACGEAVRKVMRELNLTERRTERLIAKTIKAFRAKTDSPPDCNAVAELMIGRRNDYLECEAFLKFQVGVRKFFSEGVWLDPRLWVVDRQAVRDQRRL
jgi:hypothetical protein